MMLSKVLSMKQIIAIVAFLILNIFACVFCYNILHEGVNSVHVLKVMTFSSLKVLMSAYTVVSTLVFASLFYFYNKDVYGIKNKNAIVISFFIAISLAVLILILLGYFTHGEAIRSILHLNKDDVFMDYFNSIQYGKKPYERQVIYPPFINVVYGFLGSFFLRDGIVTPLYRVNQLASMTFLIYTMAAYLLLYYSFKKCSEKLLPELEIKILFGLLLFSLPYLYLMERANSLLLAISLLLLYCTFYDSCNDKCKWLAMVLLSLAASIKITPCVFGLLYLRKKDLKAALKCFVIGILVFNIPFVLTDGNLLILMDNIKNTTNAFQGIMVDEYGFRHYVGNGHYVNLGNTITILSRLSDYDFTAFGRYLNIFVFIASILIVIFSTKVKEWQIMALLCGVIVLCPGFSAIYNLTYYTIPLVYFLGSKPSVNIKNVFYLILFILMFIPIINIKIPILQFTSWTDLYPMRLSTIIESFSILTLSLAVIFEIGYKELENLLVNGRAK